ncbi:MAG: LLM class flavin-dependent oxidoreductase [Candidatus Rokubacteria bacterium]|nr:LLM class flavin-dependent oxidoreductase [Candidatus Rokubacteria bacterium]
MAARRSQLRARLVAAALGPQMCCLAGEIADRMLFNWLTPEHARLSADWVRAGAATAGRRPPTLFAYVRVDVLFSGRRKPRRLAQRWR